MMYSSDHHTHIPSDRRDELNKKVIYLIDSELTEAYNITREDVFNAYTGTGGLHNLNRSDFENYHDYSEQKKLLENGQFFTPARLCELVMACLKPTEHDLIADLTCGMGNFFNYAPSQANVYGCELDVNAYKVARFLYPKANLEQGDIRTYQPNIRFDYVVGNPPYHLKWWLADGEEILSHFYYCIKAAELLKPLGILAVVVPQSFLADDFLDKTMIHKMEQRFYFLGQLTLPDNLFAAFGVSGMPVKLQFWQKRTEWQDRDKYRYTTDCFGVIRSGFDVAEEAQHIYESILMMPKAGLEQNRSHILLELAKANEAYKMLYQIKAHPATKEQFAKCCEYLYRFYTQRQPLNMDYKEWRRIMLTEGKVLSYLRRALRKQNRKPERDVVSLVKRDGQFVYKAYSAHARQQLTEEMRRPVPVYQAVLDDAPDQFPGFEKLLREKCREYSN